MDSAPVPTTERIALDMLWRCLSEANSNISAIQSSIAKENRRPQKAFEPLPASCKQYRETLREDKTKQEEERDTIRLAINKLLRPFLRPLTVLDLPDEVLRSVFEYVKGEFSSDKIGFSHLLRGGAAQVKNLRLTCGRFRDTSSHLLMHQIKVEMTPQSIAYLCQVSQHPTISKGVRNVKIYLGRHFDAGIARDIRAYAEHQTSRLREVIQKWQMKVEKPRSFDSIPKDVYERAIDKATATAALWEDAARNGLDENRPEHALLKIAHEQYQRSYESQVSLQRGAFGQAVAHAMKMMPTATRLEIEDENTYNIWSGPERRLASFHPDDFEDPVLLQLKLQAPAFSWSIARYQGLRSPPIDTIPSILSSLQEARVSLAGLEIRTPLPGDLSSFATIQDGHAELWPTSQPLREFTFHPRHAEVLSLRTSNLLSGFLSTMLDTRFLQKIHLSLDFQYVDSPLPTSSIARVLLSRTWPDLKDLSYNGPFYLEEMQKVVHRLGEHVRIEWSGYLMNASWAEVLDFLRDRVPKNACLGDVNGSIAGAECEEMTAEEVNFIFRDAADVFSRSRATQFIQGWTKTNPVRGWEDGDLKLPDFRRP